MTLPRFRLRSLIWAIVLIALALGVVAHLREDARRHRQLVAERQRAALAVMRAQAAALQAEFVLAQERALRRQAEAKAAKSAPNR